MSDCVTYQDCIEPIEWERNTCTIPRLPQDGAVALGHAHRVWGGIGDHSLTLAVSRAPVVGNDFPWTGRSLPDAARIAVGEVIEVRLRPLDPDDVQRPQDVARAPRSASVADACDALTPGHRRGLLHRIETDRRAEARTARIAGLIAGLRGPAP